jgi:hypothetical protein
MDYEIHWQTRENGFFSRDRNFPIAIKWTAYYTWTEYIGRHNLSSALISITKATHPQVWSLRFDRAGKGGPIGELPV